MNKLIFYKQISPRYLEFLNWILTNENLDPLSKQDIYEIITTIISYNLETQYESTIEELLELCEDTQVKNNVCFSELLSKIKHLVMKESPTSVSLAAKLLCIIKVAKHMNLKSDFDLIMQLSNSKLSQDNYEFLQVIFSNVIINTNPEIKKIILEEVLSYHMSENTIADFDFHATVFSNLTNSFALSTDAETYRKIVRISLMGESSYYLLQLLNHKGLQESKKKIAIDYYYNLNNLPSLPKNNINSVAELGKIANKNIYSIIFSPELLNMSDQEYRETLDRIPNSKSPLSYANVLASPLLNKDRQKIMLKAIDDTLNADDNCLVNLLYEVTVSTLLAACPTSYFKEVINLIIDEFNKDACRTPLNRLNIAPKIVELIKNTFLFENDLPRLQLAINSVVTCKDIDRMGYLWVFVFCNHENSKYYNDKYYINIVRIISGLNGFTLGREVCMLFTNANVPFMKDKTLLFEAAYKYSEYQINRLTYELNRQGTFNLNVSTVFRDVDPTIQTMMGFSSKEINIEFLDKDHQLRGNVPNSKDNFLEIDENTMLALAAYGTLNKRIKKDNLEQIVAIIQEELSSKFSPEYIVPNYPMNVPSYTKKDYEEYFQNIDEDTWLLKSSSQEELYKILVNFQIKLINHGLAPDEADIVVKNVIDKCQGMGDLKKPKLRPIDHDTKK